MAWSTRAALLTAIALLAAMGVNAVVAMGFVAQVPGGESVPSGQPVVLVFCGERVETVVVSARVVFDAGVVPKAVPACGRGGGVLEVRVSLAGLPVSGALVRVYSVERGCVLEDYSVDGEAVFMVEPGSYIVSTVLDVDGDGVYEYLGESYVEVGGRASVSVGLADANYQLGLPDAIGVRLPVEPLRVGDCGVLVVPGLPAAVVVGEQGIYTVAVNVSTIVEYGVPEKGFSSGYRVVEGSPRDMLPPVVLSPQPVLAYTMPAPGTTRGVLVAIDDYSVPDVAASIEYVHGSVSVGVRVEPIPDNTSLWRMASSLERLVERARLALESRLGVTVELDYRWPPLSLVEWIVEAAEPSFIVFRLDAAGPEGATRGPLIAVTAYNSSGPRILVVDPLLKPSIAVVHDDCFEAMARALEEYGVSVKGLPVYRSVCREPGGLAPHDWLLLAEAGRLRVAETPLEAMEALDWKPQLIVFAGPLPGAGWGRAVDKVLEYVERRHAGLVAVYSSVASIELHVDGRSIVLAGGGAAESLARAVGMSHIPFINELKESIGVEAAPSTRSVIASAPLLHGWVEWSGELRRVSSRVPGVPREVTVGGGAPTLVGWQLGHPTLAAAAQNWLIHYSAPPVGSVERGVWLLQALAPATLTPQEQGLLIASLQVAREIYGWLVEPEMAGNTLIVESRLVGGRVEVPIDAGRVWAETLTPPPEPVMVSSDGLAVVHVYEDPDPWRGYRAAYISFDISSASAADGNGLRELLGALVAWLLDWKPGKTEQAMLGGHPIPYDSFLKTLGGLPSLETGVVLAHPKGYEFSAPAVPESLNILALVSQGPMEASISGCGATMALKGSVIVAPLACTGHGRLEVVVQAPMLTPVLVAHAWAPLPYIDLQVQQATLYGEEVVLRVRVENPEPTLYSRIKVKLATGQLEAVEAKVEQGNASVVLGRGEVAVTTWDDCVVEILLRAPAPGNYTVPAVAEASVGNTSIGLGGYELRVSIVRPPEPTRTRATSTATPSPKPVTPEATEATEMQATQATMTGATETEEAVAHTAPAGQQDYSVILVGVGLLLVVAALVLLARKLAAGPEES